MELMEAVIKNPLRSTQICHQSACVWNKIKYCIGTKYMPSVHSKPLNHLTQNCSIAPVVYTVLFFMSLNTLTMSVTKTVFWSHFTTWHSAPYKPTPRVRNALLQCFLTGCCCCCCESLFFGQFFHSFTILLKFIRQSPIPGRHPTVLVM